jgi:hypothetical protein
MRQIFSGRRLAKLAMLYAKRGVQVLVYPGAADIDVWRGSLFFVLVTWGSGILRSLFARVLVCCVCVAS